MNTQTIAKEVYTVPTLTTWLKDAVKKAVKSIPDFIEPVDDRGEYKRGSKTKAFNYYLFTNWCYTEFDGHDYNNSTGTYIIIRDLALEAYCDKYNAVTGSFYLRGMDMLD